MWRAAVVAGALAAVARGEDLASVASMLVALDRAASCGPAEYFSSVSLACAPCADMAADAATAAALVGIDADASGRARDCGCPVGYAASSTAASCATDGACASLVCAACPEAAYGDGSGCASCGNGTRGVAAGERECACDDNAILVEADLGGHRLAEKTCVACGDGSFAAWDDAVVAGAFYAGDRYACRRCPDARMAWDGADCACGDGYVRVGVPTMGPQSCVLAAQHADAMDAADEEDAAVVLFDAIQAKNKGPATGKAQIDPAAWFLHLYANASTRCLYHDGSPASDAACQTLANLCVMTGYQLGAEVCQLYEEIRDERGDKHDFGMRESLPWLFYDADGDAVRKDQGVRAGFAFSAAARGKEHLLELRVAVYALNGTFLGTRPFETDLFYCANDAPRTKFGGGSNRGTRWTRFGYSWQDHFRCALPNLLAEEQLFYDLYLVDRRGDCEGADHPECLYPIPVLTKSLRDDGEKVNRNGKTNKETDDIFVRRFSLFDVAAGVAYDESPDDEADGSPVYVRYLVEAIFHVEARAQKPSRIYTPYLELKYRERATAALSTSRKMREAKVEFFAIYHMDSNEFWRVADALFFTMIAFSAVVWIYALRVWQSEHYADQMAGFPENEYVCFYYLKWILLYARLFVHLFFPLVFALTSYWLVFFKLQDTVYVLMPAEDKEDGTRAEYYRIRTMIICLWVFQSATVMKMVYDQCSLDIFFVDWERPRSESLKHKAPVSIWRTLFVANEWNEMQTSRRTNTTFILMVLHWFLVGARWENVATWAPDVGDRTDGAHNIALRFANVAWWWFLLAFGQWLWNFYIWERYFSEPRAQSFLDTMTVAKISIFVLDAEYHGWYLHGDAPYSHADDTMNELSRHLLNEANSESIGRGLEHEAPDQQTFQMWLTPAFKAAWNSVNGGGTVQTAAAGPSGRGLKPPSIWGSFFRGRAGAGWLGEHKAAGIKRRGDRAGTMHQIGAFLRTFLTHGYKEDFDLDFELRKPNIVERFLYSVPPTAARTAGAKGKVIFQPDKPWFGGDNGWTTVTFIGHDYELLVHEILTFAVADIWFRSTSLSVLCTFLFHHGVRLAREIFGEQNLSDRTLVDARFLI